MTKARKQESTRRKPTPGELERAKRFSSAGLSEYKVTPPPKKKKKKK